MPSILYGVLSTKRNKGRVDGVLNSWAQGIRSPSSLRVIGDIGLHNELSPDMVWPCAGGTNDSYGLLPQKMLAALRIALSTPGWDYFFKCDDDTFVIPDRLEMMLQDYNPKEAVFLGHGVNLNDLLFPVGGGGYVLSRPAICRAWNSIEKEMSRQGPEDVYLALALKNAGILLKHDERFGRDERGYRSFETILCQNRITAHYVQPEDQRLLWQTYCAIKEQHFNIAASKAYFGKIGVGGCLGYEQQQVLVDGEHHVQAISAHAPSEVHLQGKAGTMLALTGCINDTGRGSANFEILTRDGKLIQSLGTAAKRKKTETSVIQFPDDGRIILRAKTAVSAHCHSVWLWHEVDGNMTNSR